MVLSGIVGGAGLGTAMITFIWSITHTTAAITLFCLSAMPFITALLGFLFLKREFQQMFGYAISNSNYLVFLLWQLVILKKVHYLV